jgi:hypothetical protein
MYKSVLKEVTNTTNQNAKILSQLHQKPKRDKKDETPVFQNFVPNYTHQADLLYLPTAKYGYKMLLVVVDNHTHKFDAEPLKEKSSEYVAKAFKRLYDRFRSQNALKLTVAQNLKKRSILSLKIKILTSELLQQQGIECKDSLKQEMALLVK